ncbi:MAG: GntR family transcriptional regulator [Atopobiaceae bacterium]|jgi:DNA-binding GntR family transcriptional regulator|nr:GntR family transcriptional regulator [Atopobiaceae bacterium]
MPSTTNLRQLAYDQIRQRIGSRNLKEGIVYSEHKLSADIGVSRTPLHAALQQLESEGYIDILPSRGFSLHEMTSADVTETFQMRAAIELYCALALSHDTQAHDSKALSTIKSLTKKTEELMGLFAAIKKGENRIKEFVDCDYDFHSAIVTYVDNSSFDTLFAAHKHKIEGLARGSLTHPGRLAQTVQQHRSILTAIEANDKLALFDALQAHVESAQLLNLQDVR